MKRPSNDAILNALALAALIAFGAWFIWATEWVDVWKPTPPRGQAARDDHYAIKQILTKLGTTVVSPESLDELPPPGATLVLQSNQWDFVPERSQRLREWVEVHGGHLVLPSFFATGDDITWVPIHEKPRPKKPGQAADHDDHDDDDEHEEATRPPQRPAGAPGRERLDPEHVGPRNDAKQQCPTFTESPSPGAAPRRLRLCHGEPMARLQTLQWAQATWSIDGPQGAHSLRVPFGKGRITAVAEYRFLSNDVLFKGDQAQAAIAALDLRAGDNVWFVVDEKRQALLLWLWHRAGPALGLALLALALALWRGALRFGPLLPQAVAARRSVAEQIRGTAAFVWRGGGAALLAASRRALDEAARARFAGWDGMTLTQRIAALQPVAALPADLLTRALDPTLPPARGRILVEKLTLLEQARRRLALNNNPPNKEADHAAQPR
jgi:hypothetical protein